MRCTGLQNFELSFLKEFFNIINEFIVIRILKTTRTTFGSRMVLCMPGIEYYMVVSAVHKANEEKRNRRHIKNIRKECTSMFSSRVLFVGISSQLG